MIIDEDLKSTRYYPENGFYKVDMRLQDNAKRPKGMNGNRLRCSTGLKVTPMNEKYVKKYQREIAKKHYDSLFDVLDRKEELLFEDIAYAALKEAAIERRKEDGTKDYLRILERDVLPTFGKMPLKDIRPKDIKVWQALQSEKGISQSRFNKKFYVVNRVLKYATENWYISVNPIATINRISGSFVKSESTDDLYFTKGEVGKILNAPFEGTSERERLRHAFIIAFLYIALFTGGRTGEIMALKWSDIDLEKGFITYSKSMRKGVLSTTKTAKPRTLPIVKRLIDALSIWRRDSTGEYVFPVADTGKPYRDSRVISDHLYKPLLERLDIPYKILYCTRSTFASLAAERGVSMLVISKSLGHSNLATTQRFYIRNGQLDEEISRDELEKLAA